MSLLNPFEEQTVTGQLSEGNLSGAVGTAATKTGNVLKNAANAVGETASNIGSQISNSLPKGGKRKSKRVLKKGGKKSKKQNNRKSNKKSKNRKH